MVKRLLTGAAVAMIAVIATLVALPTPSQATPASPEPIYQALGVDSIPADYVVLVDVSGSMQQANLYAPVKKSLRALFAALAPQDDVTLVAFADSAKQVFAGPVGTSPDAIIAKLPAVADGAHTDIGLALQKSLSILERPSAPPIATVILLTDGKHDPKFGSPFPLEAGYGWDQLHDAAAKLHKDSLSAYAIPLTGSTSAGLLRKVYGNAASVLSTTKVDQLTARLNQPKLTVRAAKARSLLAPDLAHGGVQATWATPSHDLSDGTSTTSVALRSTTSHLPITVDNLGVTSCPAVQAHIASAPVTLSPGQVVNVPVTLSWQGGPKSWKPLDTATLTCPLGITGTIGSPWSDFLTTELHATFTPTLTNTTTTATFTSQRGSWSYWTDALALLIVACGLAAYGRWRRLHPLMTGVLTATVPAATAPGSLSLRGRQMTLSEASAGLPGSGLVRGVRPGLRSARTMVEIAYSQDGSSAAHDTGSCGADEAVTVSGVRFQWRPTSGVSSSDGR